LSPSPKLNDYTDIYFNFDGGKRLRKISVGNGTINEAVNEEELQLIFINCLARTHLWPSLKASQEGESCSRLMITLNNNYYHLIGFHLLYSLLSFFAFSSLYRYGA
jgi:hypothetical protein